MKSFFNIYAVLLVVVEVSFFFGLPLLLDLSRHYYAAGAIIALALAVPVSAFLRVEAKLEDLEKHLQDLENKESQS